MCPLINITHVLQRFYGTVVRADLPLLDCFMLVSLVYHFIAEVLNMIGTVRSIYTLKVDRLFVVTNATANTAYYGINNGLLAVFNLL